MTREYKTWTTDEEERLRALVATPGMLTPVIAKELKRPLTAVRNKMSALGLRVTRGDTPYEMPAVLSDRAADRVAQFFDGFRPIALPAPAKPKTTTSPSQYTLVGGDFHFGMHDERACSLFLRAVEELRPKRVILNGDTVDLLAVSRYPKDRRRGKGWDLKDEVTAFHGFLHTLHSIGNRWGVEVIETSANHSGNGTEGRWWRYLNDRCPELLTHHQAEERLAYQAWFFPEWSNIRLVNDMMLAEDLLVLHGDLVRSAAAYTAKASREKWMNSVIVNHTHRMGFSPKTIAAVNGRPPAYVRAYENGCLCKLEVPYGVALDWQQGFAIVSEGDGAYAVEQVIIDNGRADVATLGKTLKAA